TPRRWGCATRAPVAAPAPMARTSSPMRASRRTTSHEWWQRQGSQTGAGERRGASAPDRGIDGANQRHLRNPSRAGQYDQLARDTTSYYTGQLDDQKALNDRRMRFAITHNKQIGGSVQAD